MIVRNLQAWAGDDFAFIVGDLVEMPAEVGTARIAAGLAENVNGSTAGRLVRELPVQPVQHSATTPNETVPLIADGEVEPQPDIAPPREEQLVEGDSL